MIRSNAGKIADLEARLDLDDLHIASVGGDGGLLADYFVVQNGDFVPTMAEEILEQWCVEAGYAIEFYAQVTNTGSETDLELRLEKQYAGAVETIVARSLSDEGSPE